jgi:hypothetical protein
VSCLGERGDTYRVFVGSPEGRRLFERPNHRWEDNIKIGLQEIERGGMDWIYAA